MLITDIKFNVNFAQLCDENDCKCIESCEINYATQELDAMTILMIGVNENAWVESIEDIKTGKKFSVEDIYIAFERLLKHVKQRNPELKK